MRFTISFGYKEWYALDLALDLASIVSHESITSKADTMTVPFLTVFDIGVINFGYCRHYELIVITALSSFEYRNFLLHSLIDLAYSFL